MNRKIKEMKESLHKSTAEKSPEELKRALRNDLGGAEKPEDIGEPKERDIEDPPLVGFKIRKYLIVGCPHCNRDYEIPWTACKEHLIRTKGNTSVSVICPWCSCNARVEMFAAYNDFRYESVKNS